MLNKIIRTSLNNRVAVLAASAILFFISMMALFTMEVDIFPDLNAPSVTVMTEAGGLSPEEVEKSVSREIETALSGASGVRRVTSASATGFSVVKAEFEWGTDINIARQTVTERLGTATLPAGCGVPVLGPQSSILGEILIIGLESKDLDGAQLRTAAERDIAPRLRSVAGVAQVSVIGGDPEEFTIELSPDKLRYHGLSVSDVSESLENFTTDASGSIIEGWSNEYSVKAKMQTTDPTVMEEAVVGVSPEGATVVLGDVATVRRGAQLPAIGVASVEGRPAVLMTVMKQPGVGSTGLTDRLENVLHEVVPGIPGKISYKTDIFRQADFISNSVSNLRTSLLEGALFVVIILFIFLFNIRTTLISAIALPVSVILTLAVLRLMGLTINTMTLGGIAIAIGSLVDDAIVDVENVYKRIQRNRRLPKSERKKLIEVVFEASREVRMPILNSTLIICAAFTPLFFLSGMEGRLLKPLGVAFMVALAVSTIVALTLTPVLCSYLLGGRRQGGGKDIDTGRQPKFALWLQTHYLNGLKRVVRKPKPIFWLTGTLLVLAAILLPTLGRSFLPPFNEGSLTINISALPGISLEESDRIGRQAEEIILKTPGILTTARKTGRAELDEHSLGVNVSEIEAPYKLPKGMKRKDLTASIRGGLGHIPGVTVEIGQPISHRIDAMLTGSEAQLTIKLFGEDLDEMLRTGKMMAAAMKGVKGLEDVTVEPQIPRPQLELRPRSVMLARYGVTPAMFRDFVETAIGGREVGVVYEQGYPFPVTMRLAPDMRTPEALADIAVTTPKGVVPLAELCDIESTSGPSGINRENGKRRLTVTANIEGRDQRGAVNDVKERLASLKLPEGISYQLTGQFENEEAASRTLALTSILALIVVALLLYGEFRSWSQAGLILLNMPLAMIGGVLILVLTRSELNIPAIIGFVSLLGISTRNGMLLMSEYNRLASSGVRHQAVILRGSVDRLNPIIMTALTSALALLPIVWRGDLPGNEIQAPLALVILGGLVSSTLLNIFLLPAICFRNFGKNESQNVKKFND